MSILAGFTATRDASHRESFRNVIVKSMPSDNRGLYCPVQIGDLTEYLACCTKQTTVQEIGAKLLQHFAGADLSAQECLQLTNSAWQNFGSILGGNDALKLQPLGKDEFLLELFHGPTLAFKDFGLLLLAKLLEKFLDSSERQNVVVATSGDTGAAAAQAFAGVAGIKVFILFPKGGVSDLQRKQMSTTGASNIFPMEIDASFDKCQDYMKKLLLTSSEQTSKKTPFLSVNSVNFGRLLAQMSYYIWSWLQVDKRPLSVVVPSGNFGNALACYYTKYLGVNIVDITIAVNQNNSLEKFVTDGEWVMDNPTVQTFSNAMDISKPSNLERLIWLLLDQNSTALLNAMKNKKINVSDIRNALVNFNAISIDDEITVKVMQRIFEKFDYLIDPHTAVATAASHRISKTAGSVRLVVATAHPVKFKMVMEKANLSVDYSAIEQYWQIREENYYPVDDSFQAVEKFVATHS